MAAVPEVDGVNNCWAPPSWISSLRRFGRRPSRDAAQTQYTGNRHHSVYVYTWYNPVLFVGTGTKIENEYDTPFTD